MSHFRFTRLRWLLVLALSLWTATAQAQQYRYRYVSLNEIPVPPGILFFDPHAIDNGGRLYGEAYDENFVPYVAVYAHGEVTVHSDPGLSYAVNEGGTVGGSLLVDAVNFIEQAALFRGDQVELIPRQPGEVTSFVTALSDSGLALVISFDADFNQTILLYKNGKTTPLDFGPTVTNPFSGCAGSKISADESAPLAPVPPITTTRPSANTVAV